MDYDGKNRHYTPKELPVQRLVPNSARLYEKKGSFELYIHEGRILVNVIDYHPGKLELTVLDLEKMLKELQKG